MTAIVFGVIGLGLVVGIAVGIAIAVRVGRLRAAGTAVLYRDLPAPRGRGWRHGIVRYHDAELVYYRLTSLKRAPSRVLARHSIELGAHRPPRGSEHDVIDNSTLIVDVVSQDAHCEIALSPDALTAFRSWVESCPSQRSQRRRSA